MKTLLLCGYRQDDENLSATADGHSLIDRRIEQLRHLRLAPAAAMETVCVLAGPTADRQLRNSRLLPQAELAFDDTPDRQVSLLTNLKAGLETFAENEPCFVLPVEIPCPEARAWSRLFETLRRIHSDPKSHDDISLLQLTTESDHLFHFGFPLLVTRAGNRNLRGLQNLSGLCDPRLKCLHISYPPVQTEPILATEPKDL